MSNVIQFPLFPDHAAGDAAAVGGGALSDGQCPVTLSKAVPEDQHPGQHDLFSFWVEGTPEKGFTGGVFVVETGEIITKLSERWNNRNHLESTLEDIANAHHARWLKERAEHAPAWLVLATQKRRFISSPGMARQVLTDSMKAIRSMMPKRNA